MQHFTGKRYLAIDIANNFSKENERSTWNERLAWFEANKHNLRGLLREAHDPALFYAGVLAWEAAERGEPSGYPISLDATASGMQILACLTGDRKTAGICNVINTDGQRKDAYTALYMKISENAGSAMTADRDDTKKAIMTGFYTSVAEPKRVFGEGRLLEIFYQTMAEECPGAWELNTAFSDFWNSNADAHEWTLPDNFHVRVKVVGTKTETLYFLDAPYEVMTKVVGPQETGRSLGANITHSIDGYIVREMVRRCSYNPAQIQYIRNLLEGHYLSAPANKTADRMVQTLWSQYEKTGMITARLFDYLNPNNIAIVDTAVIQSLIDSLPAKPFEVLTVHDCFRCLPNYGNDLRQQYINLLAELASSELLSHILGELAGEPVKIKKLDPTLADDIRLAEYPLS